MAADWAKIKLEYVNGTMPLRTLAKRHKIKAAGVMARAAKGKWEDERKQLSAKISKAAGEVIAETRAEELSKFNKDDLRAARSIRAKAGNMLAAELSPQDLSALARVFEAAQKIGRLALGATTESTEVTTNPLVLILETD
jgi:hypothetical protein